jgi:DNA-binding PadR family transcriptional regulator
MTAGRLVLGPGTLYGAIQALQKNGAIKAVGAPEGGRNKKTYEITGAGLAILKSELNRVNELARNLTEAVGGN